ncbi:MAG: multiheme c-type cytochrome [candidate division KSB1 bacterium]|nr:multiheme c-type cytochrome [candidate division KSB1 bacterium]MDZ7368249.1 multiheme c-type cytochrome [candidate division KSB1 bacterium]MDZ7406769.1 multiheme c-type cytochrome [candidate division KSB1 bacterium]
MRKIYPDLILIDGGDMGESIHGPTVWKSAELFKTMRSLGYDVIGLGERDLAPAFFEEVSQSGAKEILLSGNYKPAAAIGAAPFRLIQRKSTRVGVVEVVSSFYQQGQALEPADPKTFLQRQIEAMQQQKADVTVVIYHGPATEALALRSSFTGVDLWLISHGVYQPMAQVATNDGGALIVGPGDRGREVGLITLEKNRKGVARSAKFHQIILDDRIPDSPKAAPIQERFLKRSQSSLTPPPEPARNGFAAHENFFVGSEVCRLCHEETYNNWRETKHARALETLAAKQQATNSECLPCHTVGFGEPTGYTIKENQPYLAAVGCEMCHGKSGDHVRADDQTNNFSKTTEATCLRCHDKKNSPKFVYAEYVKRVH